MGKEVSGAPSWWAKIFEYFDGEDVFFDGLYTRGIGRLVDRTAFLLKVWSDTYSAFASVANGTASKVTGTIDLSTLVYDPIIGDLNSKTLVLDGDVGGPQTVTFGTGGSAPAGPADVVEQILTQATIIGSVSAVLTTVLPNVSQLTVGSPTFGTGSTFSIISGTAASVLGLTIGAAPAGTSTISDGASLIGWFAYNKLTTSTVRSAIKKLYDLAVPVSPKSIGFGAYSNLLLTDHWAPAGSGNALSWVAATTGEAVLYIPVDVPNGATITGVSVVIVNGGTGAASKARINLEEVTSTGDSTLTGISDAAASLSPHTLALTGLTVGPVNTSTTKYCLQLHSSHGAGAAAGDTFLNGTLTFTTP